MSLCGQHRASVLPSQFMPVSLKVATHLFVARRPRRCTKSLHNVLLFSVKRFLPRHQLISHWYSNSSLQYKSVHLVTTFSGLEKSPVYSGSLGQVDFIAGQVVTSEAYLPYGQGSRQVILSQNHQLRRVQSSPGQAKCEKCESSWLTGQACS